MGPPPWRGSGTPRPDGPVGRRAPPTSLCVSARQPRPAARRRIRGGRLPDRLRGDCPGRHPRHARPQALRRGPHRRRGTAHRGQHAALRIHRQPRPHRAARVDTTVAQAERTDSGPALLVRPDGYIAWAGPGVRTDGPDGWHTAWRAWSGPAAEAVRAGR
ncbi:hypothetical protein V2J94_44115 [Streptomyces sp. DSM 41524]|uniref:FAD-binding domain-containing protein n=1 Tax=Streptomyces asiaticus subsp. ignotus TaxID=3098222 RepID=A0ABU7QBK5_9ACTN|nr:hypothetical protein [Streptomyces sp. DSM 41524]